MKNNTIKKYWLELIAVLAITTTMFPITAYAYIGPGAGLSAIGSVLALIGAILLAILGFIWFPVKRLLKKIKKKSETPDISTNDSSKNL